jgi:hypothetical protein
MNFDDLDEEELKLAKPAEKPKAKPPADPWRLGHRRPWWQWNVLTLFVALFALVWLRELAELSSGMTWILCLFVFAIWTLGPLPSVEPPPPRPRPVKPRRHDAFPLGRAPAYEVEPPPTWPRAIAVALAIMTFVGVFALGGLAVCLLSLLGAMLYAMAVRPR